MWSLQEPHYGDALSYYVPFAEELLADPGSLLKDGVPTAHPPLHAVAIASASLLTGPTLWVPHLISLVSAVVVLFFTWRFVREAAGRLPAVLAIAALGAVPVFQSQARIATPEMLVAAATSAGIYCLLRRRYLVAGLCFAMASLSKESAIVVVPLAALWATFDRTSNAGLRRGVRNGTSVAAPAALALGMWFSYLYSSGQDPFLGAGIGHDAITPRFLLDRSASRVWALVSRQGLGPMMLVAMAVLGLQVRRRSWPTRPVILGLVPVVAYLPLLAALGYPLDRYLVPCLAPLVAALVVQLSGGPRTTLALAVGASIGLGLFGMWRVPPPNVDPEGNLAYRHLVSRDVRVTELAEREQASHGGSVILTRSRLDGFPFSRSLRSPTLGYVGREIPYTIGFAGDLTCANRVVISGGQDPPDAHGLTHVRAFPPDGGDWPSKYHVLLGLREC